MLVLSSTHHFRSTGDQEGDLNYSSYFPGLLKDLPDPPETNAALSF